MNKRVTAFLCALALLVGLLPAGVATVASAETNTQQYQVGYAKVDINPWLDYEDHSKGLNTDLRLFLSGNGNDEKRLMTGLYDDNGDGNPGDGDGLFATATVITDYTGKTVVYITIDSLQGYDSVVTDVRAAVIDVIPGISKDQIMISASHTHSSFQLEYLKRGYYSRVENEDGTYTYYGQDGQEIDRQQWKNYYDHIVAQIKEAAEEAWDDRAAATMSKGTVAADEATANIKNKFNNNAGYNNGNGYHMNAIRHYEVTATGKYKIASILDRSVEKKYIIGSSSDLFDKNDFAAIDSNEYNTYSAVENTFKPVEEADNNMHLLLFEFDDSDEKLPVVFVNWRAHTTANSSVNIHALSSDYVNGLRTTLEKEGYRAAFFQGAAGNVVTTARDDVWKTNATYKDWQNHVDSEYGAVTEANKTFIYGKMLAEIAQYCIDNNMVELSAGKIRTHQMTWHGDKQLDSEGLQAAAQAIQTREKAGETINYPVRYTYESDGKTYIVNSSYHKSNIINRMSYSGSDLNLELNVIKLGNEVAFVTAPNELADKYHSYKNDTLDLNDDGLISATDKNDWNNLLDATYGTPFVLGYTNGRKGYIGNWLDYTVNSSDYTTLTTYASGAESIYSPGTYESNTCRFEQGAGEALIAQYKTMLDSFEDIRVAKCEACNNEEKEWFPIYNNGEYNQYNGVKAGHYYLAENITDTGLDGQWNVGDGSTVQETCIDLMGHAKTSESRNFYIHANATLNVMDSVGGAEVQGQTYTNNSVGGNIYVGIGGTFNLYGGTLSLEKVVNDAYPGVGWGGVVYLHNTTGNSGSTMNMFGGTVKGADLVTSTASTLSSNNGCGGAIYVRFSSALNVYGGTITSGSVPAEGYGACVFSHNNSAKVRLSGDADVEDVFFAGNTGSNLFIKGEYTGTAGLTFIPTKSLTNTMDIGDCEDDASLVGANITCTNVDMGGAYIDGENLRLSVPTDTTSAILCDSNGAKAYDALSDAITDCSDNGYVKLTKDASSTVTINKDVTIDLNGYNMSDVAVSAGTLYGMDSQTDDYTVSDEKYGKISNYSGEVAGVPAGHGDILDNYLMIEETEEGVSYYSFHRVNLQVHTMSLRPNAGGGDVPEPGIYYKSYFAGDEKVKDQVERFGVALSVYDMPNAVNMDTKCEYSKFTNFISGKDGNESGTSTLLKGIMKVTNSESINKRNANMDIYGRAYVQLEDGTYLFGLGVSRNLREQIELMDNEYWYLYSDSQKNDVAELCNTYPDVTKSWNIPNIRELLAS